MRALFPDGAAFVDRSFLPRYRPVFFPAPPPSPFPFRAARVVARHPLVRAAEDCAKVQNSGVLDAYVDAARALARERKIPVADAYAEWNRLEAAGVDTTALLANDINHPTEDMHGVFVEKIMDALLRGEG